MFGKKITDTDTDFDPAPSPRGPEEPPAGVKMDTSAVQALSAALGSAGNVASTAAVGEQPALVPLTTFSQRPRDRFDAVVDRWFSDCIKGGPIGRHTPSFNHIQEALAELKRRLNEHLKRED